MLSGSYVTGGVVSSMWVVFKELAVDGLCLRPWQWRPQRDGKDLRLQDFCFFEYQGKTVIASMMKDFCSQGMTLARPNSSRRQLRPQSPAARE